MADQGTERFMSLERVYVKDLSFESPQTPGIFASNPDGEIELDIQSAARGLDAERAEVTLTVTVKCFAGPNVVFRIELAQAGIFGFRGYTPDERTALLSTECPLILQSYARVAVSDAASKGGFAELLLQPIDFHGLYAQKMQTGPVQSAAPGPAPTH